jgi:hypothetical protein
MESKQIIKYTILIIIIIIIIIVVIKSQHIFDPPPPESHDQKCETNKDCASDGVDFYCNNDKICTYKQTINSSCDDSKNLPCVSNSNCVDNKCKIPFLGECLNDTDCSTATGQTLNCYKPSYSRQNKKCLYKLGDKCDQSSDCGYINAICDEKICKIENGMEGCVEDNDCVGIFKCLKDHSNISSCKINFDEACYTTNDCIDPNMACDREQGNVCKWIAGQPCKATTDCTKGNNCLNGICTQQIPCIDEGNVCDDSKFQYCCADKRDTWGRGLGCTNGTCQFPYPKCYPHGAKCDDDFQPCCDGWSCERDGFFSDTFTCVSSN